MLQEKMLSWYILGKMHIVIILHRLYNICIAGNRAKHMHTTKLA